MKSILFFFFLMFCVLGNARKQLNDYKYIIVPKRLAEFKKDNQYLTSTLLKHLLTQKGFTVVYEGSFPDDLATNVCLGLTAYLEDNSSMFMTKSVIKLKDCTLEDVFISQEGRSRSKEYKSAYKEVITNASKSFDMIDYVYTPKVKNETPITVSFKNDVKHIEEKAIAVVEQEIEEVIPAEVNSQVEAIKEPLVVAEQSVVKVIEPLTMNTANEVLYAQQLPNGYQLVDSTPSIKIKMYKSSREGVYLASGSGHNGVVYQQGEKWYFEYHSNNAITIEELTIKF